MTVRRTTARSLCVLALTAPLGLALAPSAHAASSITAPAAGAHFTGPDSDVTATASVPTCPTRTNLDGSKSCTSTPTTTLTLKGSAGGQYSASKTAGTSASSVSVVIPAGQPNQVWTATSSNGDSESFTVDQVNVPDSFSAVGSGPRDVTFAWNKGSESGITGYVLSDSNGTVIDDSITPASASCASSNRCSYGLYYPADNPGTHDYLLAAKRTGSSGSAVTSGPAKASATLTPPPKPTPTPAPSASTSSPSPGTGGTQPGSTSGGSSSGSTGTTNPGGSTGGTSTGGSTGSTGGAANPGTTGGTTGSSAPQPTLPPAATDPVLASRRSFALTFNAFSPSLGIPKLPPLPATDLPAISEGPLPVGTYKPSLPYQSQTETTTTRSLLSSPKAFVETITDPAQLAKSIAGALILLLVGAHLRRFLASAGED